MFHRLSVLFLSATVLSWSPVAIVADDIIDFGSLELLEIFPVGSQVPVNDDVLVTIEESHGGLSGEASIQNMGLAGGQNNELVLEQTIAAFNFGQEMVSRSSKIGYDQYGSIHFLLDDFDDLVEVELDGDDQVVVNGVVIDGDRQVIGSNGGEISVEIDTSSHDPDGDEDGSVSVAINGDHSLVSQGEKYTIKGSPNPDKKIFVTINDNHRFAVAIWSNPNLDGFKLGVAFELGGGPLFKVGGKQVGIAEFKYKKA